MSEPRRWALCWTEENGWSVDGNTMFPNGCSIVLASEYDRLEADKGSNDRDYLEQCKELTRLREREAKLVECLTSISKNSCCDQCQQAKFVALAGLAEWEKK